MPSVHSEMINHRYVIKIKDDFYPTLVLVHIYGIHFFINLLVKTT